MSAFFSAIVTFFNGIGSKIIDFLIIIVRFVKHLFAFKAGTHEGQVCSQNTIVLLYPPNSALPELKDSIKILNATPYINSIHAKLVRDMAVLLQKTSHTISRLKTEITNNSIIISRLEKERNNTFATLTSLEIQYKGIEFEAGEKSLTLWIPILLLCIVDSALLYAVMQDWFGDTLPNYLIFIPCVTLVLVSSLFSKTAGEHRNGPDIGLWRFVYYFLIIAYVIFGVFRGIHLFVQDSNSLLNTSSNQNPLYYNIIIIILGIIFGILLVILSYVFGCKLAPSNPRYFRAYSQLKVAKRNNTSIDKQIDKLKSSKNRNELIIKDISDSKQFRIAAMIADANDLLCTFASGFKQSGGKGDIIVNPGGKYFGTWIIDELRETLNTGIVEPDASLIDETANNDYNI